MGGYKYVCVFSFIYYFAFFLRHKRLALINKNKMVYKMYSNHSSRYLIEKLLIKLLDSLVMPFIPEGIIIGRHWAVLL